MRLANEEYFSYLYETHIEYMTKHIMDILSWLLNLQDNKILILRE